MGKCLRFTAESVHNLIHQILLQTFPERQWGNHHPRSLPASAASLASKSWFPLTFLGSLQVFSTACGLPVSEPIRVSTGSPAGPAPCPVCSSVLTTCWGLAHAICPAVPAGGCHVDGDGGLQSGILSGQALLHRDSGPWSLPGGCAGPCGRDQPPGPRL